ncbi:hypothetical protein ACFOD4_06065 [Pseudoroseomonas globiformis]|uniref:Lipoprotein n=1 Tax=Teichococcus globiformis TaxID=2307229 RepID=A0ABV7FW92_9PROT
MKRLLPPLLVTTGLLLAACAAPSSGPVPRPGPAAGAGDPAQDAAIAACRQEVERSMRYRERGQTMRVDEAESRLGAGAFTGSSLRNEQLGARYEQDRMMEACLRGTQPGTGTPATPPPGGGRGS